ncbi:HNH endonuclease [Actinospica sp. MGRD01-02]|uniref:HNH endonuclease n=1 Tax=Actinospica acidithermotolerans TaxID=2828514 RepID=A0A941E3B0_9ACTN|nr:HNH endonuclease [Actinospica acidithermotolerans]MBR7825410.1 HNH endonuclease [Actinospica acidithermotolerans]
MTAARPRGMYTPEKLIPAVAAAGTLGEVLTNLGLEDSRERRAYVSRRIKALGIDGSHLHSTSLLYTDADLREAVSVSATMVDVAVLLGAKPMGGTIHHLRRRIDALGLDTGHFNKSRPRESIKPRTASVGFRYEGRRLVVDEAMLRAVVPRCHSVAHVVRMLGMAPSAQRCGLVREEARRLGLDTRHFLGQGHLRGIPNGRRMAPEAVLIFRPEQLQRAKPPVLRRALIETGMAERCAGCGTGPEWLGRPLTLELDHINGDFRDNRRENLRFMCPNCHATTDNYCRKKSIR